MFDPRSISPQNFQEYALKHGIAKANARALLGAVIGQGDLDPESWAGKGLLSPKAASQMEHLPSLKLESVTRSKIDGFSKLLFLTEDNFPIETVIIPLHKENKVSICLSSQVGCVMGCVFCATGKMKQRKNLASWQILDQMAQARKIAAENGEIATGAVFMGMGEPFLNYSNVMIAAEHLCNPVLNAISAKAITISTVGVLDKINRFIDEERPFRLSISLGAATDEGREKLVPIAARTPLKSILQAAKRYTDLLQNRINLSYVCISGENMTDDDAQALGNALRDIPVRLDLIEVTDSSGEYKRPSDQEMSKFRDALNVYLKQPVARRYSGGADISAACGTLAGTI